MIIIRNGNRSIESNESSIIKTGNGNIESNAINIRINGKRKIKIKHSKILFAHILFMKLLSKYLVKV